MNLCSFKLVRLKNCSVIVHLVAALFFFPSFFYEEKLFLLDNLFAEGPIRGFSLKHDWLLLFAVTCDYKKLKAVNCE